MFGEKLCMYHIKRTLNLRLSNSAQLGRKKLKPLPGLILESPLLPPIVSKYHSHFPIAKNSIYTTLKVHQGQL